VAYKSFKTEIDPNPEQAQKIRQTIGVCRYVYNLYLAHNKEVYENNGSFVSAKDFNKHLNHFHCIVADPWIKDVSTKAVSKVVTNAEIAFKRFFNKQSGFPKYKKKSRQDQSFYMVQSVHIERHRVKLPTLGWVKLKEFGYIPTYATVKSATVTHKAGRYYISVLCEDPETQAPKQNTNQGLGLDLGIKDFAISSDGQVFGNINKTIRVKKLEKRLKREQNSLSRKLEHKKSNRGECTYKGKNLNKKKLRVQVLHKRLADVRKGYQVYVIKQLAKTKPAFITIENLQVKNMMRNRHLSKAIQQQSFYQFKLLLTQACKSLGIELREVSTWYPSSKMCSSCGVINRNLKLSDRQYICDCGLNIDRDINSSLNLKQAVDYKVLV